MAIKQQWGGLSQREKFNLFTKLMNVLLINKFKLKTLIKWLQLIQPPTSQDHNGSWSSSENQLQCQLTKMLIIHHHRIQLGPCHNIGLLVIIYCCCYAWSWSMTGPIHQTLSKGKGQTKSQWCIWALENV